MDLRRKSFLAEGKGATRAFTYSPRGRQSFREHCVGNQVTPDPLHTTLTSLSKLASKWILFGLSMNSLLTSMEGCSPSFEGAYIIFLIANLTEFLL